MKKQHKIRLPAKAGVWYVLSSALIKLAGMALTPFFTAKMSQEEYGKYALYMSWIALLSVIITLGLTGSVVYRGMQKFRDRRDEFLSSALGLSTIGLAIFVILLIIWGEEISLFIGLQAELVKLLVLQIALDTVVAFFIARCRYLYGYKGVITINICSALLSLGVSLALVQFVEATAKMRIYALLFSTLVFALPLLIVVIFKGKRLFCGEIWAFLLKFNLPLLPHAISAAILANVDKVMISGAAGGAALAKYSVAHSLGVGMTFVTGGLGSALQPWIMRKIGAKEEERVRTVSLKLTILISLGALGILSLAPEIFAFLAPNSYADALISVYPITVAAICGFVSTVASVQILHAERTGLLSLSAIIGAAVNVGANCILLPYSYNGAAFSFLLAGITTTAVSLFAAERIGRRSVVKILPTLAVFVVAVFTALFLYNLRVIIIARLAALALFAVGGVLSLLNLKRDILE